MSYTCGKELSCLCNSSLLSGQPGLDVIIAVQGRKRHPSSPGAACLTGLLRTQVYGRDGPACSSPCVSIYVGAACIIWPLNLQDEPSTGSLKDDDLAGRMGLQVKELSKVTAVLENDKLVKV